jgi:hypothetical protein
MSEPKEDGGPAFPPSIAVIWKDDPDYRNHGMSLRDWFAGQALCGLLASNASAADVPPDAWVKDAYDYADAMLIWRKQGWKKAWQVTE